MIILAALVFGALTGWSVARRRGGRGLDQLQYAAGYGIALAATDPAPLDPALLQDAFAQTKISAQSYLATVSIQVTDPMPNGSEPIVLEDADFLGLQYICDS